MEMLLAFTSTAATSVRGAAEGAARVVRGKHQYRETGKAEQKKLSQLAVWGHALSQRDPEQRVSTSLAEKRQLSNTAAGAQIRLFVSINC